MCPKCLYSAVIFNLKLNYSNACFSLSFPRSLVQNKNLAVLFIDTMSVHLIRSRISVCNACSIKKRDDKKIRSKPDSFHSKKWKDLLKKAKYSRQLCMESELLCYDSSGLILCFSSVVLRRTSARKQVYIMCYCL